MKRPVPLVRKDLIALPSGVVREVRRRLRADSDAPDGLPSATTGEAETLIGGPTPIEISVRTRNVLLLVGLVALLLFVRAAPNVPRLFLTGATLALVLSFPVRLLERVMRRSRAIIFVVVWLLLVVVLTGSVIVPLLLGELTDLAADSPQAAIEVEEQVRKVLVPLEERDLLPQPADELIAGWRGGLFTRVQDLARTLLLRIGGVLTGAVGFLIQLFGVLFIAIYLLADIDHFKASYLWLVPDRYRRDADELWETLGRSLSRYLSGLLVSITLQGVAAVLVLWVLDVPYGLVLGLWMSATALLPYIGSFLGAIPAILVALTVSPLTALLTAIAYFAINQVEGNFLTPRIQGQAVRVHPLLIFLAVIAGSQIAGILGALLAVPTLAVLRVLGEFFIVRLRVRGSDPVSAPD
jgi:predicted PurR-regulated permease PerM